MHLGGLDAATITRCLRDLAEVTFRPAAAPPQNFGEVLLRTFGREMCEVFLFPYNRKVWQRPLESLAPAGFTWNITPPDFEKVVQGALDADAAFKAYNSDGFYPRPHPSAPVRGMEVLSRALARRAADLRLGCRVESIDADRREVHVREGGSSRTVSYGRACLATVPLPHVVAMCRQAPDDLRDACRRLTRNRVMSVCLSVRGPRPEGRGFWRYYADESLIFTRLVYMHEFDPATAPNDGWGLLVEIVEPAEWPLHNSLRLLERVRADVERAGALPEGSQIVDEQLMLVDPAYVVFTPENRTVVAEAREFLARHDILTLGRYGRWEYSSMGQVMRDGFALGRELLATRDEAPQAEATAGVAGQ
jgi:protoporphyrinogen oxidase